MTPAQRKYDLDLVASMYRMAAWIEPRSRKVSDTLKIAAARIAALTGALPDDPAAQLDQHGNKIQPENKIQPNKIQSIKSSRTKSSPRQRRTKNR